MRFLFSKKITTSLIASFLVFSFVFAPISQTFHVQFASVPQTLHVEQAEAFVVWDPGNWVANYGSWVASAMSAISDAATAAGLGSLVTKEYILDTIVWGLINIMLQEMIKSITLWVANGFQGSPAFLTDLQGFLINLADKVAGNFIYGTPLGMLCSPFKLNIQLALDIQYGRNRHYEAKCKLSDVINNAENFLNGDFIQGGWDGWYSVALTPSGNPYGAMLEAQGGLTASIRNAQGREIKLLDFGKGFFSKKGDDGKIVTPGDTIQASLNKSLGLPADRLVVAKEINELLGTLFAELAKQVLGGAAGLLGLGKQDSYGQTYFDRMEAERIPQSYNAQAATGNANIAIAPTIPPEEKYLGHQNTIIDMIVYASTYKERTYPPQDFDGNGTVEPNTCHSGTLTTSLSNKLGTTQREASTTPIIIANLRTFDTDYGLLVSSTTPTSTIAVLLDKYTSTSIQGAMARIMEEFMAYSTSGQLHDASELVQIELKTIPDLQKEIDSFTQSIDTACRVDNSGGG